MKMISFDELIQSNRDNLSILLHCRPKSDFHLGNIYFLNKLYELLNKGHFVTVLILPFDEDVQDNEIIKNRIYEDIEITKRFFLNYLGNPYNLKVISSMDIELSKKLVTPISHVWTKMLSTPISELEKQIQSIIQKTRKWAYNKYFIPKSVAAICNIKPTHIIFGKKHTNIAVCFNYIIKSIDESIAPELVCVDDYLAYDEVAMDSVSYPQSCINILDSKNALDNKLFLNRDKRIDTWLEKSVEEVIKQSPPRYWEGIYDRVQTLIQRDRGILIDMLNHYINAVKKDLLISNKFREKTITCDKKNKAYLGENQPVIFEILKDLFATTNAKMLKIHNHFTEGYSGSYVFEVLVSSPNSNTYINSFIVKIDKHSKIVAECNNYGRYIEPNQTFSFVKVTKPTKSINGWGGLVYKDVKMWFGAGIQKDAFCLRDVLQKFEDYGDTKLLTLLIDLIDNQIYYTLYNQKYEKNELQNLSPFFNEIMPAEYTVFVNSFDRATNTFVYTDNMTKSSFLCRHNTIIADLKGDTYTLYDETNTKINMQTTESVREIITPNCNAYISFCGKIVNTRNDFYLTELRQVGGTIHDNTVEILGKNYTNVLSEIDTMLTKEWDYLYTSPVHGDLHTNNLMICDTHIAVIDYGLIREHFFTAYDCIVLLCDIIINVIASKVSITDVIAIVSSVFEFSTTHKISEQHQKYIQLISIFKYSSGHKNTIKKIPEFCSSDAYHAAISLRFLTIIKYANMSLEAKQISFILSCLFCEKALHF
jgi:hypothetical protein